MIVPRHPERFEAVFQTALTLGFRAQKRSDGQAVAADTQVWIGDSMGELYAYYAAADAAFVGGSLVDSGCQNIIEPIACGLPTVFGFSTYNFDQACRSATEAGAAVQVRDADEWRKITEQWLSDDRLRRQVSDCAEGFIRRHRGASETIASLIAEAV